MRPVILHAGQALAETVQTTHLSFTTNEPVELIVFLRRTSWVARKHQ